MDETWRWSPQAMLSCTAFEFGDPSLTPACIGSTASSNHGLHQPRSLHPGTHSPTRSRPPPITATLYPVSAIRSSPLHASSSSYGVPFPGATVRVTRQSISVYRSADRQFLVDIRWADVTDVKCHVPEEDPSVTEIAVMYGRGVMVLDVAALHVATGLWSALILMRGLTEEFVKDVLRLASRGPSVMGVTAAATTGSRSTDNIASHAADLAAANSPSLVRGGVDDALVARAQQVLDRFLGHGHNLVVSPQRSSSVDKMVRGHSTSADRLSSPKESPTKPLQRYPLRSAARQKSEATEHQDPLVDKRDYSTSAAHRSSSQLSSRERADVLRREQDEQLQRLRRREEDMRRDIRLQSTASTRGSVTRSTSASSSVAPQIPALGFSPRTATASPSPIPVSMPRALRPSAQEDESQQRQPARKPPLPIPPTVAGGGGALPASSRAASSSFSILDKREQLLVESVSQQETLHDETTRAIIRDDVSTELNLLVEALDEAERTAAAGAKAQTERLRQLGFMKSVDESASSLLKGDAPRPTETHSISPKESAPTQQTFSEVAPTVVVTPESQPLTAKSANGETVATESRGIDARSAPSSEPPIQQPSPTSPKGSVLLGWKQLTTPEGKTYFFHPATKKTTWRIEDTDLAPGKVPDRPSPAPQPAAAAAAMTNAEATEVGEGWKAMVSDSGRTYYVHVATKRTTWKIADTHALQPQQPHPTLPSPTTSTEHPTTKSTVKLNNNYDSKDSTIGSKSVIVANDPAPNPQPLPSTTVSVTPENNEHRQADGDAAKPSEVPTSTMHDIPKATTATATVVIQDVDEAKHENEARKRAAIAKAEEDKQSLKIGKFSLQEALLREREAMLAAESANSKTQPTATPTNAIQPTASSSPMVGGATNADTSTKTAVAPETTNKEATPGTDKKTSSEKASPGKAASVGVAVGAKIFGSWKELYHKETQRTYYRHVVTNEATWKVPPEVQQIKDAIAAKEASMDEAVIVSSLVQKSPSAAVAAAAPSSPASSPPAHAPRIIGSWKEMVDPKSNRKYYVNTETKERTWKVEQTPFASHAAA